MSDLIDRDALKKELEKFYRCDWETIRKELCFAEVVDNVSTAEPEPKWIRCNERMPEEVTQAICIDKQGKMMIGSWTRWGWIFPVTFEEPVAWMSLPKPLRGE